MEAVEQFWNEGCVWDSSDTECDLDEQNIPIMGGFTLNPTTGCGWGGITSTGRMHYYDCDGVGQQCNSRCYKPCRK